MIKEDPVLSNDIKMFSIAIGNDRKQIGVYKKKFRVAFPMFPDKKYEIYGILGRPGTSVLILATKEGKVLTSHKGVPKNLDELLAEIREIHKNQGSKEIGCLIPR